MACMCGYLIKGVAFWLFLAKQNIIRTGPDNNCTKHCYEYRGAENAGRKKIGNLAIKMIWERDENFGEWSTNKTWILNIL